MAVKLSTIEKSKRETSRAFHEKEKARLEYENDPFGSPLRTELPEVLRESKMGRPAVPFKELYERAQKSYQKSLNDYRKLEQLEGLEAQSEDSIAHHLTSEKSSAGRISLNEIGLIEKYKRRKERQLKVLVEEKERPYLIIENSEKSRSGRPRRSYDKVKEGLEKNIQDAKKELKWRIEGLNAIDRLEYEHTVKKLHISLLKREIKHASKNKETVIAFAIQDLSRECHALKSEAKKLKKAAEDEVKKTVAEAKKLYLELQPKKHVKSAAQIKKESASLLMEVALCLSGERIEGVNVGLNLLSKTDLKIKFREIEEFLGV